jgi:hypothetical protein
MAPGREIPFVILNTSYFSQHVARCNEQDKLFFQKKKRLAILGCNKLSVQKILLKKSLC